VRPVKTKLAGPGKIKRDAPVKMGWKKVESRRKFFLTHFANNRKEVSLGNYQAGRNRHCPS
jgi:hypothetical protein